MKKINFLKAFIFIALHIPLAYMMDKSAAVATAHAYISLLIGLYVAIIKRYEDTAFVAAYIIGSEVLWRMTGADIFWESGKYAVSLIFLLAALRKGKKIPGLALLYFILLLPSCYITAVSSISPAVVRGLLSFNLSGPLTLMMAVWYFWSERFEINDYFRMAVIIFAPLAGIDFLCFHGIANTTDIIWGGESMFAASGGFGPNQVSGALGFGALLAFIIFVLSKNKKNIGFLAAILTILFTIQSALTFSRSGVYFVFISAALGSLFLITNNRTRMRAVFAMVLLSVAVYFIAPHLNAMTGGKLTERFRDTAILGREELLLGDLEFWKENVVFGIGPGMGTVTGRKTRTGEGKVYAAAHTEFSRLLGEHGLFGLFALLSLAVIFRRRIKGGGPPLDKGVVAMLGIFTFLYFSVSAMRTALPGFVFGLMLVHIMPDQKKDEDMLDGPEDRA